MRTKVFSVYDAKALFYGVPFFMPMVGMATRSFGDLIDDPRSAVNKHPEDYSLFLLGEFDDQSGVMVPQTAPSMIITGNEYLSSKKDKNVLEVVR